MTPEQIKKLRETLGLTQEQLAELIGAQRVTVARWETGVSRPTGAYLKLLLEVSKGSKKTKRG